MLNFTSVASISKPTIRNTICGTLTLLVAVVAVLSSTQTAANADVHQRKLDDIKLICIEGRYDEDGECISTEVSDGEESVEKQFREWLNQDKLGEVIRRVAQLFAFSLLVAAIIMQAAKNFSSSGQGGGGFAGFFKALLVPFFIAVLLLRLDITFSLLVLFMRGIQVLIESLFGLF